MASFTRRDLVRGATCAAGAAALVAQGSPAARAAAPGPGLQPPAPYRYKLGKYEITALSDGIWDRPVDDKFVRNASPAEVRKAMAHAFMPSLNTLPVPFTALLVNTGTKRVLIDTGSGGQIAKTAGTLLASLADANVSPAAVDTILISHFHPDHINGIKTKNDELVFPKAEIRVPAVEWSYWMDESLISRASPDIKGYALNARRIFRDIAKDVSRFDPGTEVAPGIAAIAAPGHTPGHVAFSIFSEQESILVLSDTSNHPALFLRHPEWQPAFDMDGALAATTRKQLLDRAVADRMLVQGYHFPFPACGHVARDGSGYEFVPLGQQPL